MDAPVNPHIMLDAQRGMKPWPYHTEVARLARKYSQPGDAILDVGTGAGTIPMLIGRDRVIDVTDAYQSCLDVARDRAAIRDTFLLDEATFDIRQVDRQYHVVTMSHVLEHMRDPLRAVEDVLSLVAPGGHLVLAVPNPVTPLGIANAVFRRRFTNEGHTVCWDPSHWRNFLERIMGLEVVEYAADFVMILPARLGRFAEPLERALASVLPWMAFSNIAVVKANPPSKA